VEMNVEEVIRITPDIDGQIYVRDFKLIEQSDMIVSLVPELPDGTPALSSGVERELQHAHETTRDVFVIWKPKRDPSPFITETATRVFRSTEEAINYFVNNGYVTGTPSGSLFGG
jgi:adenylate kinase